jgi:hypothetical protein
MFTKILAEINRVLWLGRDWLDLAPLEKALALMAASGPSAFRIVGVRHIFRSAKAFTA